jgi:hypothetical protein
MPQVCIACSIFRNEIEQLQAEAKLDLPVRFLGSMLHMVPEKLEKRLLEVVKEERAKGHEVVLAYGDCCPNMIGLGSAEGVGRTQGFNCPEILLGKETYRKMRRDGVFFLLPEWTLMWRAVFQGTLGLLGGTAQDFMKEMHTRLVYLDTKLVPVPEKELAEISEYCGLPVERMKVSLEPLLESLRLAATRITHE